MTTPLPPHDRTRRAGDTMAATYAEPRFVREAFASFGIETLSQAINSGSIVFTPEVDLENYCRVAIAVHEATGPLPGDPTELADQFAARLLAVLSGESRRYRESPGGRAELLEDHGEWIEVTPQLVRHWQWMRAIIADRYSALALLGAVAPIAARVRAQRRGG